MCLLLTHCQEISSEINNGLTSVEHTHTSHMGVSLLLVPKKSFNGSGKVFREKGDNF